MATVESDRVNEDVRQLLELAMLQSNRYIKELLREKKLPMGVNKDEFQRNLREAISGGQLTAADLRGWLAEVEGWGDQHAYLFRVPTSETQGLRSLQAFSKRAKLAELEHLIDAEIPFDPDEDLRLSTIRHHQDGISLIWVKGSPKLARRSDLDFEENIDGEDIVFQAYERRWARVAARFEWRFESSLAALFISRKSGGSNYSMHRDELLRTVDRLTPSRPRWKALNVSKAITQIDSSDLQRASGSPGVKAIRMNKTTFVGASAQVELSANSQTGDYQDDAEIRQVRKAVDGQRLIGGTADCYVTPNPDREDARLLHIRLYSSDRRALLWGNMNSEEVWELLPYLYEMSR
jgi:hypothetical protein